MTRYRILPYKQGSRSAKALADRLGGKVLRLQGSTFVPRSTDVIINWGNVQNHPALARPVLNQYLSRVFNDPGDMRNASNKKLFFERMKEDGYEEIIPRFWTNRTDIPQDAYPVVCRTVLAGHSGAGIVIADSAADVVAAPLYVEYVKKEDEYRVHVGVSSGADGSDVSVISVQRKARKLDVPDEEVNWKVRNLEGGFVYVRQGVNPPASVIDAAKKALVCSGLDFGAVDVIYNRKKERAYVLEINTAPGLEGQTVEDYGNFFQSMAT